ncbi:hypothetical protein [Mesorhizobium sp. INR15]|uniref:hypothetical protein n=1 Tax=Mesorhizobium sp. INR15 TaxID=2654248 RepID=UPI0018964427|nr:hypothetical protein [Mesorhizobium sp. INR15]
MASIGFFRIFIETRRGAASVIEAAILSGLIEVGLSIIPGMPRRAGRNGPAGTTGYAMRAELPVQHLLFIARAKEIAINVRETMTHIVSPCAPVPPHYSRTWQAIGIQAFNGDLT